MSTDTPPRKIHFVTTPGLGQSSITQVQKAAKSHAAREAHAKLRHLRMRKYQERNAESEKASSAGMDDRALIHISCDDVSGAQVPGKNLWKPTLLDSLSSSYRNPFYTIGRPLKEVENFLFHHCKCRCFQLVALGKRGNGRYAVSRIV